LCIFDSKIIVFANRRLRVLEYPPYTLGIAPVKLPPFWFTQKDIDSSQTKLCRKQYMPG